MNEHKIVRRKTRVVKIGTVTIGGNHPVAIQSMVKVPTKDADAVVREINALEKCGCEIIRVAVKDTLDAQAIREIKRHIRVPLVADIHFDWRLALTAIENGVDKVRLNPGNIQKKDQVKQVVEAAKSHHIPIRVGVNSGSVLNPRTARGKKNTIAQVMVTAAAAYIKMIEKIGFYDLVVSLKASTLQDTLAAYRLMAKRCDYPFHLGVTATGLPQAGMIKSSIATGVLLLEGIGDTIRVSLTDEPQEEVKVARDILEAVGIRRFGPQIVSCPTCGRCEVDLLKVVNQLESALSAQQGVLKNKQVTMAVMGCIVNGPGEAKEADLGIAFGKKEGLFFKHGKAVKKIAYQDCVKMLLEELRK